MKVPSKISSESPSKVPVGIKGAVKVVLYYNHYLIFIHFTHYDTVIFNCDRCKDADDEFIFSYAICEATVMACAQLDLNPFAKIKPACNMKFKYPDPKGTNTKLKYLRAVMSKLSCI